MTCRAIVAFALTPILASQAGQLVGPAIDASAAIAATPGFGAGGTTLGACRDNQGNYWTTHKVAGVTYLLRITVQGVVTGVIPTSLSTNASVRDLAFDGQRNRIWVESSSGQPQVFDALSGVFVGLGTSAPNSQGIAWDGADRIVVASYLMAFDADSLQWGATTTTGVPPPVDRGLLRDPGSASYWGGFSYSGDPAGITESEFRQFPLPGATMPPDLALLSATAGKRGGTLGGCEAWFDSANGEWLGVFCQIGVGGTARLYTCRLSEPAGGACGGATFSRGPSIVQSRIYTQASSASGFAWLLVGFGPASISVPIFQPGCTIELDPAGSVILGAFLPDFSGNVVGGAMIPVMPSIQEMPVWFQWTTLTFSGSFYLSEGRAAAVKQF
jgi:hypothetical protein